MMCQNYFTQGSYKREGCVAVRTRLFYDPPCWHPGSTSKYLCYTVLNKPTQFYKTDGWMNVPARILRLQNARSVEIITEAYVVRAWVS